MHVSLRAPYALWYTPAGHGEHDALVAPPAEKEPGTQSPAARDALPAHAAHPTLEL